MGENKYTYENWLKGEFDYNHIDDSNGNSLVPEDELKKIHEKQLEILENYIHEVTEDKKKAFDKTLGMQTDRKQFIKNYKSSFEKIFNEPIEKQEIKPLPKEYNIKNKLTEVYEDYAIGNEIKVDIKMLVFINRFINVISI